MSKFSWYFWSWIGGWSDIIDGTIVVLTFGLYNPWISFRYRVWLMKHRFGKR